ncbi:F-box protein SKIP19 [Cannabis sativa]|uniref:F-box protein SKIP19 n=1 Tax=Cannabis sativa TaxID=3483 RepID=UPI0011DF0A28|nr:F-box protein SKIP19 [Cannabis sativa]
MASSTSTEPSPPEELRNWLELPRDVTASILSRLGSIKIMTTAQMVCKSWLYICKDPYMWRTIDIHSHEIDSEWDSEKMCRDIVDRSCGQLVDFNIEKFGNDELLRYITASSSQIKRLRFASCSDLSDEGLIEAIGKLPLLEELDLTHCEISETVIEALGRCCPHLKTLKLYTEAYARSNYFFLDQEIDFNNVVIAISKNLPELRHLQLIGSWMNNLGLQAILDGCCKLESLDLRRCLNINLKGDLGRRCAEQIKLVKLPSDSLEGCVRISDPGEMFSGEDDDFPFADQDPFLSNLLEFEDEFDDDFDIGYSDGDGFFDYDDFTAINYDEEDFY